MEGRTVKHLSFNREKTAFVCAGMTGFKTFETATARVIDAGPTFSEGGSCLAEMLENPGLVAVVGAGTSSLYPRNKVLIWNENTGSYDAELEVDADITGLYTRKDCIVAVTRNRSHVFGIGPGGPLLAPKKLCVFETGANPTGLCALSRSTPQAVLAFPSRDEGFCQLLNLETKDGITIKAHSNGLACMEFNNTATWISTASVRGTCIRIFNTRTGDIVRELRRGIDRADIRCMAFSGDNSRLLVSSGKANNSGTVHVFALTDDGQVKNAVSRFKALGPFLPSVFSSEWSFAQFHIDEPHTICAFGRNRDAQSDRDTFVVVGFHKTAFTCKIDPKEKTCCRIESASEFPL